MKTLMMTFMIILLFPLTILSAENNNNDLLKAIDNHMQIPVDMILEFHITTFKEKAPVSSFNYMFFTNHDKKEFLLICLSPLSARGFAYMKRKNTIWAFTPAARAFFTSNSYDLIEGTVIRIEDFLPKNYNQYYKLESSVKTNFGGLPALLLKLTAKSETVQNYYVSLWIHEKNKILLKEEFYDAPSHFEKGLHPVKTIKYSGYREVEGMYLPSKIIISDFLQDNMETFIHISRITLSPVPEYVFTRSFIEFITQ